MSPLVDGVAVCRDLTVPSHACAGPVRLYLGGLLCEASRPTPVPPAPPEGSTLTALAARRVERAQAAEAARVAAVAALAERVANSPYRRPSTRKGA